MYLDFCCAASEAAVHISYACLQPKYGNCILENLGFKSVAITIRECLLNVFLKTTHLFTSHKLLFLVLVSGLLQRFCFVLRRGFVCLQSDFLLFHALVPGLLQRQYSYVHVSSHKCGDFCTKYTGTIGCGSVWQITVDHLLQNTVAECRASNRFSQFMEKNVLYAKAYLPSHTM